ncbi:MAG: C10 family peptidase [Bacteroidales bacterium]|nr:C10 family peptidase [Bacteroidales bacterium]
MLILYVIPMGGGIITSLTNIHSAIVYPESFTVFNYFHMNWGWYGNNNGYFYQDNISVNSTNFNVDRKNLIIDAI